MTRTIFADTSFLVAFYNIRDDNHQKARAFIAELIKQRETIQFHITDYIFDETLTTILSSSISFLKKHFHKHPVQVATFDRHFATAGFQTIPVR